MVDLPVEQEKEKRQVLLMEERQEVKQEQRTGALEAKVVVVHAEMEGVTVVCKVRDLGIPLDLYEK